jgi:DnaJ-class molecular chaperone
MNYYEILGVPKEASADDIKRAYRKLASQHHPDKGGDTRKFQEIQTAYDTLGDPDKRQQYDNGGQGFRNGTGFQEFHFHHGNIDDIFRQFGFGGGDPFGQFRQQPRRNKDLRIEIPVPLITTLEEQTKTVSIQTTNGERQTVEVKIPRGVTNSTQIKYSNLGDNLFNTLPRGDLYVHIAVHNAEGFIVNNIDLYTKVSVNCLLAIVGGPITVNGLDSRVFELTIPPGTEHGKRFRIPQQGLYRMNTVNRGDLYVEVELTVPQNLSSEQLELVSSIVNNL